MQTHLIATIESSGITQCHERCSQFKRVRRRTNDVPGKANEELAAQVFGADQVETMLNIRMGREQMLRGT